MEAYYDVREPGSYGGVDSLYKTMKRKGEPVTYKQAAKWLAEQTPTRCTNPFDAASLVEKRIRVA